MQLLGGGGGFTKNQNRGGGLPKKGGALTVCQFRGGAWQEKVGGVLGGVETTMHMSYPKIIWHMS